MLQLPKPKGIRMGNWEANVLSKAQLEYAATDAFASWYLYEVNNLHLSSSGIHQNLPWLTVIVVQVLKSLPVTAEKKIEEQEGVSPQ